MAQVDTGLGWSASGDYLGSVGGATICNFGGLIGGPEIPYAATAQDAIANGFWTYKIVYPTYETIRYLARNDESTPVIVNAYFYQGNNYAAVGYSTTRDVTVTEYTLDTRTSSVTTQTYRIRTSSPVSGVWMGGVGSALWGTDRVGNPDITIYPTEQEAINAPSILDMPIKKLNNGYSVACVLKWRSTTGIKQSPILISSNPDYIKFAYSGTYSEQESSHLWDGMRFYMRYIVNLPGSLISSAVPVIDVSSGAIATSDMIFRGIAGPSYANIIVTETVDPYDPFGNTEEGGGEQDPNPEDDDIEEDPLPTTSFADAGFCRIYSPSLAQLDSLSNYLWTDQTFLQTVINHLKQIIENPIDAIISLSLVPCVPPTSTAEEVKVMFIPTGVYMPPVTNQFVEIDCGTFTLKEMYGSALDYNPYTSVQLYLPYVGIVQLDTDEVMGKTIHVGYRIDVVTGVCCAYVKAGGDVLYQFSGHCSIQQPITSADFSGYINAVLAAGKLVASIAAAGAGAPEVAASLVGAPAPSVSSTSSDTRTTERNAATGRQITAGTQHKETKTEHSGASFGEVAARGISNTVGAVMNSKTIVQHSGGFSGNSGYLAAVRRPYLIVTRPRIANPEQYAQFNGRPSMIYLNLGSCTGYTQVQSVHLTGIDATNPELSEIATLLTSGVIF